MKFKPMDAGDYWSYSPKETAVAVKDNFYPKPTEEQIARGIPAMQLVEVYRIKDAPCREIEDAKGLPHSDLFVSLSMTS